MPDKMRDIDSMFASLELELFFAGSVVEGDGATTLHLDEELVFVFPMRMLTSLVLTLSRGDQINSLDLKIQVVLEFQSGHGEVSGRDVFELVKLVAIVYHGYLLTLIWALASLAFSRTLLTQSLLSRYHWTVSCIPRANSSRVYSGSQPRARILVASIA